MCMSTAQGDKFGPNTLSGLTTMVRRTMRITQPAPIPCAARPITHQPLVLTTSRAKARARARRRAALIILLPRGKCNGQICAPCASCAPLPMLRRASPRRAWAQSCSWAQLCSCVAAVRHVLASSAPASPVAPASPPVSATQSRSARSVPSSPNGLHLTSWRSSLSREVQAWRRFICGALSVLCHVISWHLRKLGQIADSLLWHGIQPK